MSKANLLNLVGPIGYDKNMNETEFVNTTASGLIATDVITGSGFRVRGIEEDGRCPGRFFVTGNYPLSKIQVRTFNGNQNLTVRRLTSNI